MDKHLLNEISSLDNAPLHENIKGNISAFMKSHKVEEGDEKIISPASLEKAREFMGELLQEVLKLEFSTIPLYLTAAYSLVQKHNKIFKLLVRIAVEEMSHMTVVANFMVAIGVQPRFTKEHAPKYPGPIPLVREDGKTIIANLRSFRGTEYPKTSEKEAKKINKEVIEFFKRIELPEFPVEENFVLESVVPEKPIPETVGELYLWLNDILVDPEYPAIGALLKDAKTTIHKQIKLQQIPIKGVNDMRYHPIRLYPDKGAVDYTFDNKTNLGQFPDPFNMLITDVKTAQQYLGWVAGEGEGASIEEPWAPSGLGGHYFRFSSILKGKHFVPKEEGEGGEYAGNDLRWELDKICAFDTNPQQDDPNYSAKTNQLMKEFDENYSKMLYDLEAAFKEEEAVKKKELYRRSTRVWMKEMGMSARRLIRHMIEEDKPIGKRGGLPFNFIPDAKPDPIS